MIRFPDLPDEVIYHKEVWELEFQPKMYEYAQKIRSLNDFFDEI